MAISLVLLCLLIVIGLYFSNNPLKHTRRFMIRRFVNWFPLGMTYAFLYMGRYNLNVVKNALGAAITKEEFGLIFAAGTVTYACSFFLNGPLVDKIGGKKGILIASIGAAIFNGLMGLVTYLYLMKQWTMNLTLTFSILYSLNMFFQSYGAVSIIKVKAYWFHVRERGMFGAIFGTLISFGVYFAFDWGQAIADAVKLNLPNPTAMQGLIRTVFAVDGATSDAVWLVFLIPAVILLFWALLDLFLIKDTPDEAGFDEFDPMDASSDDGGVEYTMGELLKKILTSPILLTVALVEFTSGVLRNGIMQWYLIFAREVPQSGYEFLVKNWGLVMMITGIVGGFAAGTISDKIFHSRRGPPAVILNLIMLVCMGGMAFTLTSSPLAVAIFIAFHAMSVIGVHSIMSGTAAADFGGRKATATASGITDACVYLGSGIQSIALGYLTTANWHYWPVFLVPFTILGLVVSLRLWKNLPEATRRYLVTVEQITITIEAEGQP